MRTDAWRRIAIGVVFVAALSAYTTLLAYYSPRVPTTASLVALAAAVVLFALPGAPRLRSWFAPDRRRDLGGAVTGGVLMFFVAPWMVLANHHTDAPPGSQVVFTTTACWGAIIALAWATVLFRRGQRRAAVVTACGALAAVVGSAVILADWERPSSFSPFVRYPLGDVWMVAAGLAFAAGVWLLVRASSRVRGGGTLLPGALAALFLAMTASLTQGGPIAAVSALASAGAPMAVFALTGAVAWVAALELARDTSPLGRGAAGLPSLAAALFLPAAALSLLARLEPLLGASGPDPLLWAPVAAGTLLTLAGALTVMAAAAATRADRPLPLRAAVASLAPALIAIVGMALPALRATLSWNPGDGRTLDIAWTLAGAETAAGWWALAVAALLLAAVLSASARSRPVGLAIALFALACVPAYLAARGVPLHTWNTWLAPEVQQDYGTPYAALMFAPVAAWPLDASVVLSGAGLALVSTYHAIVGVRGRTGQPPAPKSGEMR